MRFSRPIGRFSRGAEERPDYQGYVINYLATDMLPDDREKFGREKMIVEHIAFRRFDHSRLTIVRGGFRPDMATELWLIPPGVQPPEPSGTVPEPKVPENKTFLFARNLIYSPVEENLLDEFVLFSVKEREKAEFAAIEAEEQSGTTNEMDDQDSSMAPDEGLVVVDERTPKERDEDRFQWANTGIGRLLVLRKNDKGILIFYADDQRYDIGKLRQFVEQGRNLLAEHAPIRAARMRIEFGGYRDEPQVEFWVMPTKGKAPVAKPDERPAEQPELQNK